MNGKKIIITNNLKFLKSELRCTGGRISYLIAEEDANPDSFREYLSAMANAQELRGRDYVEEKEFITRYSSLIYNLNMRNASRFWWAINFTNKNPLLTPLCKDIYDFIAIKRMAERSEGDVVVVMSNAKLSRFIKRWGELNGFTVRAKVFKWPDPQALLSAIPFLSAFYVFVKLMARMIVSKFALSSAALSSRKDYIIITQFENRSFSDEASFDDVYFGRLGEFLSQIGKSFITCGFVACDFRNVIKKKDAGHGGAVYPFEHFLSITDLLRCLLDSVLFYMTEYSISGHAAIYGEDVSSLIKGEIDRSFRTGQIFVNFSVYYSAKKAFRISRPSNVIYPFENRAWEKMMLLASRELGGKIKTIGYYHTSLTPKQLNVLLEDGEISRIPFPSDVIASGRMIKTLLEKVFSFPKDFVKIGCALRQEKIFFYKDNRAMAKKPGLFVALAMNLDEYVRMMRFLDKASLDRSHVIKIRPHPGMDFNKALGFYKPRNFDYILDKSKRSIDALKDTNIILYASSTVGMEALAMGNPVIYIDFGNFISSDPLFNLSSFKWRCEKPEKLQGIIDEISSLEKDVFNRKRDEAILYAKDYFYPVNSENIKPFLCA